MPLDLCHQITLSDCDANMLAHRTDDLFVVGSVNFPRRFFTEEYRTNDLITHDKRHKQLKPTLVKANIVNLKERQNLGLADVDRSHSIRKKLALILTREQQAKRKILAKSTHRQHIQLMPKP